jgi:uncharacterized membrane protein YesL
LAIFSPESKFSRIMFQLAWGCYLNLLWFVCSLPVVTIGAATTALYYVTLKIAEGEEGDITQQFFRAFRSNFKQATVLWLIMLVLGIVLGTDIYVLRHLSATTTGTLAVAVTLCLALVIVACIVYAFVLSYVFPLVARVENANLAMLKNALLMSLRYLSCTICVLAIHFAMLFIVINIFTPAIALGEGVCALLSSYLLSPVLRLVTRAEGDMAEYTSRSERS